MSSPPKTGKSNNTDSKSSLLPMGNIAAGGSTGPGLQPSSFLLYEIVCTERL